MDNRKEERREIKRSLVLIRKACGHLLDDRVWDRHPDHRHRHLEDLAVYMDGRKRRMLEADYRLGGYDGWGG